MFKCCSWLEKAVEELILVHPTALKGISLRGLFGVCWKSSEEKKWYFIVYVELLQFHSVGEKKKKERNTGLKKKAVLQL